MTRKDYVLLAHALHTVRPRDGWVVTESQWEKDIHAVACALRSENPRFDYDRFIAACETGSK